MSVPRSKWRHLASKRPEKQRPEKAEQSRPHPRAFQYQLDEEQHIWYRESETYLSKENSQKSRKTLSPHSV